MPVLARFYGIVIRMYFLQSEHNPPHIHAIYNDDDKALTCINLANYELVLAAQHLTNLAVFPIENIAILLYNYNRRKG